MFIYVCLNIFFTFIQIFLAIRNKITFLLMKKCSYLYLLTSFKRYWSNDLSLSLVLRASFSIEYCVTAFCSSTTCLSIPKKSRVKFVSGPFNGRIRITGFRYVYEKKNYIIWILLDLMINCEISTLFCRALIFCCHYII